MSNKLRTSAEKLLPAVATIAALGGVAACASEKPDAACSPKTQIDLSKVNRSVNGNAFDAGIVQINNAVASLQEDSPMISVSQREREDLASSIESGITANDDDSTPEIETGKVCIELDHDESGYPLKATVSSNK